MAENLEEMALEGMNLEDFKPGDVKEARKKLVEMLDDGNLTDEMKENLKALLGGSMPVMGDSATGTYVALVFGGLLFSVILFFGYKLYKSIKEKEKKREEKKKAKQMKKKK